MDARVQNRKLTHGPGYTTTHKRHANEMQDTSNKTQADKMTAMTGKNFDNYSRIFLAFLYSFMYILKMQCDIPCFDYTRTSSCQSGTTALLGSTIYYCLI